MTTVQGRQKTLICCCLGNSSWAVHSSVCANYITLVCALSPWWWTVDGDSSICDKRFSLVCVHVLFPWQHNGESLPMVAIAVVRWRQADIVHQYSHLNTCRHELPSPHILAFHGCGIGMVAKKQCLNAKKDLYSNSWQQISLNSYLELWPYKGKCHKWLMLRPQDSHSFIGVFNRCRANVCGQGSMHWGMEGRPKDGSTGTTPSLTLSTFPRGRLPVQNLMWLKFLNKHFHSFYFCTMKHHTKHTKICTDPKFPNYIV